MRWLSYVLALVSADTHTEQLNYNMGRFGYLISALASNTLYYNPYRGLVVVMPRIKNGV